MSALTLFGAAAGHSYQHDAVLHEQGDNRFQISSALDVELGS